MQLAGRAAHDTRHTSKTAGVTVEAVSSRSSSSVSVVPYAVAAAASQSIRSMITRPLGSECQAQHAMHAARQTNTTDVRACMSDERGATEFSSSVRRVTPTRAFSSVADVSLVSRCSRTPIAPQSPLPCRRLLLTASSNRRQFHSCSSHASLFSLAARSPAPLPQLRAHAHRAMSSDAAETGKEASSNVYTGGKHRVYTKTGDKGQSPTAASLPPALCMRCGVASRCSSPRLPPLCQARPLSSTCLVVRSPTITSPLWVTRTS